MFSLLVFVVVMYVIDFVLWCFSCFVNCLVVIYMFWLDLKFVFSNRKMFCLFVMVRLVCLYFQQLDMLYIVMFVGVCDSIVYCCFVFLVMIMWLQLLLLCRWLNGIFVFFGNMYFMVWFLLFTCGLLGCFCQMIGVVLFVYGKQIVLLDEWILDWFRILFVMVELISSLWCFGLMVMLVIFFGCWWCLLCGCCYNIRG